MVERGVGRQTSIGMFSFRRVLGRVAGDADTGERFRPVTILPQACLREHPRTHDGDDVVDVGALDSYLCAQHPIATRNHDKMSHRVGKMGQRTMRQALWYRAAESEPYQRIVCNEVRRAVLYSDGLAMDGSPRLAGATTT